MAAGIVRDGERQVSTAGFANIEAGYALVPNSLFMIGSITKIYTATLVMKLVEQGILDLDTPVVTYLPEFTLSHDGVRDAITIRMLLSHTSGFDGDRFISYGRGDDAYQRAIAEFHTLTQWFQPGSFYSYNNAGFYLVGHIIQTLTGKTYEQVLTEELLTPLGLQHTLIYPDDALNHAYAAGHLVDRQQGARLHPAPHLPRHAHPAGGIMQSVGDLLTFAQLHLNLGEIHGRRIISRESALQMQQPLIEADAEHRHYGIGWAIYDRPSGKAIGHGGAWGGHRANLIIYPAHNFAHAALSNSNTGIYAYQGMEDWALQHHLHITKPNPARIDLSASDLATFAGTYLRHDGRYVVEATEDGLHLTVTDIDEDTGTEKGQRHFDLEPVAATRFRVASAESRGATVDFRTVPDALGTDRDLIRIWGRVAARSADVS
jgi:CubicO group peptidase (beta-lactamase class C family)